MSPPTRSENDELNQLVHHESPLHVLLVHGLAEEEVPHKGWGPDEAVASAVAADKHNFAIVRAAVELLHYRVKSFGRFPGVLVF